MKAMMQIDLIFFRKVKFIDKGSRQKKPGLFIDIDHISLNTHPPPPKDDIYDKSD